MVAFSGVWVVHVGSFWLAIRRDEGWCERVVGGRSGVTGGTAVCRAREDWVEGHRE